MYTRNGKGRWFVMKGVMCLMLVSIACFANVNDELSHYRAQGDLMTRAIPQELIEKMRASTLENKSKHQSEIDKFLYRAKSSSPLKNQPAPAQGAILFVSFSMSESLLLSLADEAAQFNIPVVINGLVDGDFKKTIETFARLNKDAKEKHLNFKGLSIDPVWFEQFQIKSVPALVVTERPGACEPQAVCASQIFDVVYGNPRIKKGLEMIATHGDAAPQLAKQILEAGHV